MRGRGGRRGRGDEKDFGKGFFGRGFVLGVG